MFYSIRILSGTNNMKAGITTLIIESVFIVAVAFLIIFHTYLALSNLTTWECLSWSKVSYLTNWPTKYRSPFNIGLINNVKLYFCYKLKNDDYYVWKMPKKLFTN